MGIEAREIHKSFGNFQALNGVSLLVPKGSLMALLGPSGSGKTTLLRIIAGLECPDSGMVIFEEENITERRVQDRRVGFVFQHYALFRHMTVAENIAFGLRVLPRRQRPTAHQINSKVMELLQLIQLEGLEKRYPSQLSGGQKQRVALARALAMEPKVLLLDEPFGALDAKVRKELRAWLRRLHDKLEITSIFVTHDQDEALELADQIVVMNRGQIEQKGTPHEVFHNPQTEFVMRFLGEVNQFHGRVEAGQVEFESLALPVDQIESSGVAKVFLRPHDVTIDTTNTSGQAMAAHIERINSAGARVRIELMTESEQQLVVDISQERFRSMNLNVGQQLFVRPRHIRIFSG